MIRFQFEDLAQRLILRSFQDEWFHDGSSVEQVCKTDARTTFTALPEAFWSEGQFLEFLKNAPRTFSSLVHGGLRGMSFEPHLFSTNEALELLQKASLNVKVENHDTFREWLISLPLGSAVCMSFVWACGASQSPCLVFHSKSSVSKFEADFRLARYGQFLSVHVELPTVALKFYPFICSDFLFAERGANLSLDLLENQLSEPNVLHFISVINCTPVDCGPNGTRRWKMHFTQTIERLMSVKSRKMILLSNYGEFPRGPRPGGLTACYLNLGGQREITRLDSQEKKQVLEIEIDISQQPDFITTSSLLTRPRSAD